MLRVPEERELLDMGCRSCGGHHVRLVIDLGDQPLANRLVKPGAEDPPFYPLRLGYCEDCTLLQIDHTIPRDDMFRDYVYVSGTTDTLKRHFAETTERLSAYLSDPGDLVVDIGSNDGTWLETWKGKCRRQGVDPAYTQFKMMLDKGIDGICAYFDLSTARALRSMCGPAKLITSAGSFFHMEDLHGAVEGVKHLLADDGVFVCQAISGDDMIEGNAFDQVLHEHLCFYTPTSFGHLMRLHGLYLFKTVHHPIHGGTNEYHVRKATSETEVAIHFPTTNTYYCQQFARRVLNIQRDLVGVLKEYRALDKLVFAYGAPGKGGTLLNSFGIGRDLIQYAVEKNPLKYGLEIPGCRVPIGDERSPLRPPAYLVLAWNFLDEFLVKEREYLKAGGEFIVPVPEVRIITGDAV